MGMRRANEEQSRGTRMGALRWSSTLSPAGLGSLGAALILGWAFVAGLPSPAAAETSPDDVVPAAPFLELERGDSLELLLEVPGLVPTRVEETDASLATAARAGTNPELRKESAFRKRSVDLFHTERDIEILRQEMQLRFRVRPKTRETMSVELRF